MSTATTEDNMMQKNRLQKGTDLNPIEAPAGRYAQTSKKAEQISALTTGNEHEKNRPFSRPCNVHAGTEANPVPSEKSTEYGRGVHIVHIHLSMPFLAMDTGIYTHSCAAHGHRYSSGSTQSIQIVLRKTLVAPHCQSAFSLSPEYR